MPGMTTRPAAASSDPAAPTAAGPEPAGVPVFMPAELPGKLSGVHPPPRPQARAAAGPAPRQPMVLQALGPVLVGGLLLAGALIGPGALVVGVAVVQLLLVLGLLALVDAPASDGIFVISVVAVGAGDALVLRAGGDVGPLAGSVALALVASLLHQLVRRRRERITESLADTLLTVTLVSGVACLVALLDRPGGDEAVAVALAAGTACLLAGRLGDLVLARPALAVGATRGWPGMLLGLGAGVAAAVAVTSVGGDVQGGRAALLGLAVAATVTTADLAVDLGAAELRATRRDARRTSALGPVGLLLPFAALGPVALVAGRLVLP